MPGASARYSNLCVPVETNTPPFLRGGKGLPPRFKSKQRFDLKRLRSAPCASLFTGMSGVSLIGQHLKDSGETSFSNRSAGFDLSRSSPPQLKIGSPSGELSAQLTEGLLFSHTVCRILKKQPFRLFEAPPLLGEAFCSSLSFIRMCTGFARAPHVGAPTLSSERLYHG